MAALVLEGERSWIIKEPRLTTYNGRTSSIQENVPRDGRWGYNGDPECPTFTPSVNASHQDPGGGTHRNHYVVTAGMIHYCSDCTHELAGQTLPLVAFTDIEVEMHNSRMAELRP